MNYEFFSLLTKEVEKREKAGNKAGAQQLGHLRDQLLVTQRELQEATQEVLKKAQATLDEIMDATNIEEGVLDHLGEVDDAFMHVLEARLAHAEQSGHDDQAEKLRQIQDVIIAQIQGDTPPEIQLLSQMVNTPDKADRDELMAARSDLISDQFLEVVDMLQDQARTAGQEDLADRLNEIRSEVNARLLVTGQA